MNVFWMYSKTKIYLRAMRPHQWVKNLLVFAPPLAGHILTKTWQESLSAFISFSLLASGVYLLNDLADIASDRAHPTKRNRPLAAGDMLPRHALVLAAVLISTAFLISILLPVRFFIVITAYLSLSTAYTLYIKRHIAADVIALACLYGLRIVAGSIAAGIIVSNWLAALAIFFFLSLALVKRCAELSLIALEAPGGAAGRSYTTSDLPLLYGMASASGYLAVLVLALYLNSPDINTLYSQPHRLWLLCPIVLFWLSRVLLITHRGQMTTDPIVFAVTDRASLVCGVFAAAVVALSL